MSEKYSDDQIADAVRAYWEKTLPQDVVVFFDQKYSLEATWTSLAEVVFCESDSDYETVSFLNDFCEGQTCVRNTIIVPLREVLEYYAKMHQRKAVNWDGESIL